MLTNDIVSFEQGALGLIPAGGGNQRGFHCTQLFIINPHCPVMALLLKKDIKLKSFIHLTIVEFFTVPYSYFGTLNLRQYLMILSMYRISSVIRQSFFLPKQYQRSRSVF